MYSIAGYGEMLNDTVRMNAFAEALRQSVRPGSVVVDIGTGPGIFAMLACRFGAGKVYAIETDDVIQLARQVAAANNYDDRIEFIQELSTEVILPEKADIIISDLRGVLPLFQKHLPSIMDIRQRLLKDGGILIAQSDSLWATIVEAPGIYADYDTPWADNAYELDMQATRQLLINNWRKVRIELAQLLVQPYCWATINYSTVNNPNVATEITWIVERTGTAHGLALWFDSVLGDGIGFSNAPGQPKAIYGNAFFPLAEPVALNAGDTIALKLRADLVGDDYVWCWDTCIRGGGDSQVKADFRQSTLYGAPLSPAHLKKRAAGFVPRLVETGEIDRMALDLMAAATPLGEIANQLAARFPSRFPKPQQALTHVGELSLKYARD